MKNTNFYYETLPLWRWDDETLLKYLCYIFFTGNLHIFGKKVGGETRLGRFTDHNRLCHRLILKFIVTRRQCCLLAAWPGINCICTAWRKGTSKIYGGQAVRAAAFRPALGLRCILAWGVLQECDPILTPVSPTTRDLDEVNGMGHLIRN